MKLLDFYRRTSGLFCSALVLGLVAAMMFFRNCGKFRFRQQHLQALPILALLIPLWHCYNLIIQFVSTVSGASVAENALKF